MEELTLREKIKLIPLAIICLIGFWMHSLAHKILGDK